MKAKSFKQNCFGTYIISASNGKWGAIPSYHWLGELLICKVDCLVMGLGVEGFYALEPLGFFCLFVVFSKFYLVKSLVFWPI